MAKSKFKGTAIAVAVATAIGGTVHAVDFPIRSINVTSGSFEMANITGAALGSAFPFGNSSFGGTAAQPSNAGGGSDVFGGVYTTTAFGPRIPAPAVDPNRIVSFDFFGSIVNTYTTASTGPKPFGVVDPAGDGDGTITLDMTSFFANWNGSDFNQGNSSAGNGVGPASNPKLVGSAPNPYVGYVYSNTFDGANYTAEWTAPIIGGAFDGRTGRWVFRGTAVAAPFVVDDDANGVGTTPVVEPVLDDDLDAPGAAGAIDPASLALIDDPGVTEVFGTCALGTGADVGSIVYTSTAGDNSADACKYTVASTGGAVSDVATLSITIGTVVPPTVMDDGPLASMEDTPLLIDVTPSTVAATPPATGLLANDSDDGTFSLNTFTQPADGVVMDNLDGTLTYTPPDDFAGTTTFTYDIIDDLGAPSAGSATVTISVAAVNDDPVAPDITGVEVLADSIDNEIDAIVLGPASDIDNDVSELTVTAVGPATNGTTAVGSVLYTPDPGFEGADSFTYTIGDGAGGSASGTISVNVASAGAEFNVISGTFTMPGVSPGGEISLFGPGSEGIFRTGVYSGFSGASPGADADVVTSDFDFFGFPVDSYTAATGIDTDVGETHAAPSIDTIAGTADLEAWYAFWNGTEFNQGSRSAINNFPSTSDVLVTDLGDGTFKLAWSSFIDGGPFDGRTGFWTLTVQPLGEAPRVIVASVALAIMQGGFQVTNVTLDGGEITVDAGTFRNAAGEVVAVEDLAFAWQGPSGVQSGASYILDPADLTAGESELINLTVTHATTAPDDTELLEVSQSSIILNVLASGTSTPAGQEDANGNGVPDSMDVSTVPTELQTDAVGTALLNSDVGSLRLGTVARCMGGGAAVTEADILAVGGIGCTAGPNTDDNITDTGGTKPAELFDIELHGVDVGGVGYIAIPITAGIPAQPVWRKYTSNPAAPIQGWRSFDKTEPGDGLFSATQISPGVCPPADPVNYTPGLTTGHDCVLLCITDGGANDDDLQANGVIIDPGGVGGFPATASAGGGGGGGCSLTDRVKDPMKGADWFLLAGFVTWMAVRRRKRMH